MDKRSIIFSVVVAVVFLLILAYLPSLPTKVSADSTASAVSGYLWSKNIGWIKLDPTGNVSKDVSVNGGSFNGYAWGSNIGWIDFNPATTSTNTYPEEPLHGVQFESDGKSITGWARACSVFRTGCSGDLKDNNERGSWDGWIKMHNVTFDQTTKKFSGFAWGSLNLGWINFYNSNSGTTNPCDPNTDPDACCPSCGGGGPSVNCSVTPGSGSIGTEFTWYATASGFTSNPKDLTYVWSGDDGIEALGQTWSDANSRMELDKKAYDSAGAKKVTVTVTDPANPSISPIVEECKINNQDLVVSGDILLTVNVTGIGTVHIPTKSDCINTAGISPEICENSFVKDSEVVLSRNVLDPDTFCRWSGDCESGGGTGTTCTVKMDVSKTITADFKPCATVTITPIEWQSPSHKLLSINKPYPAKTSFVKLNISGSTGDATINIVDWDDMADTHPYLLATLNAGSQSGQKIAGSPDGSIIIPNDSLTDFYLQLVFPTSNSDANGVDYSVVLRATDVANSNRYGNISIPVLYSDSQINEK